MQVAYAVVSIYTCVPVSLSHSAMLFWTKINKHGGPNAVAARVGVGMLFVWLFFA